MVQPIAAKRFLMPSGSRIATAGSCFAQNVAKALVAIPAIEFLRTEPVRDDQPLFSALYGNIYTARQLRQLFLDAVSPELATTLAWRRPDGRWVDARRPSMFAEGFDSPDAVGNARRTHLAAVRRVFTECSVLVFTMGLTEAWISEAEGAVVPVAPGVIAEDASGGTYRFHNFSYDEILRDMEGFFADLTAINPQVSCILTVSPVPLVATYTDDHVLVATMRSKSILRAVCSALETAHGDVYYFPSYEIIEGHYNAGAYFDANKRTVTQPGIDHVMEVFRKTYFRDGTAAEAPASPARTLLESTYEGAAQILCDENLIDNKLGF
jgi:hypothetical protein